MGFSHEHQRSDQDKHLIIHKNNINKSTTDILNQFEPDPNSTLITSHDYYSIMHYSYHSFGKQHLNGSHLTTITPTNTSIKLTDPAEKIGLSKLDIYAINLKYKCQEHKR